MLGLGELGDLHLVWRLSKLLGYIVIKDIRSYPYTYRMVSSSRVCFENQLMLLYLRILSSNCYIIMARVDKTKYVLFRVSLYIRIILVFNIIGRRFYSKV